MGYGRMRKEPEGLFIHTIISTIFMTSIGSIVNCPLWISWPCAIIGGIAAAEAIADMKEQKEEVDDNL